MNARQLALDQHGWAHAATVSGTAAPTTADRLVLDLSDAQLRERPSPALNSIAWTIWHMARIEDVAINALVAGDPQVLSDGGWAERLGLPRPALGTGMDDEEVAELSGSVHLASLLEYRIAVGRRTRHVIERSEDAEFDRTVDPDRITRLVDEGSIGASAAWLAEAWRGQPLRFFVAMPAIAHSYMHLGEGWCIRTLLGATSGR